MKDDGGEGGVMRWLHKLNAGIFVKEKSTTYGHLLFQAYFMSADLQQQSSFQAGLLFVMLGFVTKHPTTNNANTGATLLSGQQFQPQRY